MKNAAIAFLGLALMLWMAAVAYAGPGDNERDLEEFIRNAGYTEPHEQVDLRERGDVRQGIMAKVNRYRDRATENMSMNLALLDLNSNNYNPMDQKDEWIKTGDIERGHRLLDSVHLCREVTPPVFVREPNPHSWWPDCTKNPEIFSDLHDNFLNMRSTANRKAIYWASGTNHRVVVSIASGRSSAKKEVATLPLLKPPFAGYTDKEKQAFTEQILSLPSDKEIFIHFLYDKSDEEVFDEIVQRLPRLRDAVHHLRSAEGKAYFGFKAKETEFLERRALTEIRTVNRELKRMAMRERLRQEHAELHAFLDNFKLASCSYYVTGPAQEDTVMTPPTSDRRH